MQFTRTRWFRLTAWDHIHWDSILYPPASGRPQGAEEKMKTRDPLIKVNPVCHVMCLERPTCVCVCCLLNMGFMLCEWWPEVAEMTGCHWSCGIDPSRPKVGGGAPGGMFHVVRWCYRSQRARLHARTSRGQPSIINKQTFSSHSQLIYVW